MITPVMQSGSKTYGVNEYIVDTEADVPKLPTRATPGSTAVVIDSGNVYILNNQHVWKLFSSSHSGGSGSDDGFDADWGTISGGNSNTSNSDWNSI